MTPTTTQLEPCPFCGTIPKVNQKHDSVFCDNPECHVAVRSIGDSVADAIAAWNRRSPALAAIAADRNKREGEQGSDEAWKDLFWKLAQELNCLPSSFVDGNRHVFRAAREAMATRPNASAAPVSAGLSDEDVEREAKLLWNIFAASHHTEWDNEPNKAEYRNAARSILARALEARMRVPGGWVSVPREPTEAMKQAGYHAPYKPGLPDPYHAITIYKAMIAAAPTTNSDLERHKKEPGQEG